MGRPVYETRAVGDQLRDIRAVGHPLRDTWAVGHPLHDTWAVHSLSSLTTTNSESSFIQVPERVSEREPVHA